MSDTDRSSAPSSSYPGSVSAELWAKIKLIDAEFKTNVNQGTDRNEAVCESLQRCFDLLATSTVQSVKDLRDKITRFVLQNQLLSIAVDLGWLAPEMDPERIAWGHRQWLNGLLDGRIAYCEARLLGGHCTDSDPGYVIQRVPETDPILQSVEALEAIQLLQSTPPKQFSMAEIRIHASSAYGVRPEDVTDEQLGQVVHTLLSKYGRIRIPVPEVISAAPQGDGHATAEATAATVYLSPAWNTGSDLEKGGPCRICGARG
jgi:hypothetical protein